MPEVTLGLSAWTEGGVDGTEGGVGRAGALGREGGDGAEGSFGRAGTWGGVTCKVSHMSRQTAEHGADCKPLPRNKGMEQVVRRDAH